MNNQNICNICGANYEYKDGKWRCPACGAYKPEEISNEEQTLLYNAAQKLRQSAFDDAEEMYRDITGKYPENSEGYWGLVLAKYGIKYERDYDGKMVPSCYAASYESILGDENYKKALKYADADNKKYYQQQAALIEDVRRRWVEIAEREEPYDIFISYKDSDKGNGAERTQDSNDAYELYAKLKEKGYRVFYSRESLAGKEGEKFEPYIFNALNTAQVMIVYGTKPEYIESTWVKNEWMRYYKRIRAGQKQENSLILAYKGFNPSRLPKPLCDIQGIDLGRITVGFVDLETRVANILSAAHMRQKITRVTVKDRQRRTAEKINKLDTVAVGKITETAPKGERQRIVTRSIGGRSANLSVNAEKILKVAETYLANGQFAEAEERFDEILRSNPLNGRALVGKFLAQVKAQDFAALVRNGISDLPDTALIEKVLANAEKAPAEAVLQALCAAASNGFNGGDVDKVKTIVSLIRDYDSPSVAKLRGQLYNFGLTLIDSDEQTAEYFLDINLSFEESDEEYAQKLHVIVDKAIEGRAFTLAGHYAKKLEEADGNSYSTQLFLLEIAYRVCSESEVLGCIDNKKEYGKIEFVLSVLDKDGAAKWLKACFSEISLLLKKGMYAAALRWVEVCAKYRFDGRKDELQALLAICLNHASMKSAECFDTILTYVADGNTAIYAKDAETFADSALSSKEYEAAKLYYGKALALSPENIHASRGAFYADIRCINEKQLPDTIVNLEDWSAFEDVLVAQTDDADDLKWIEKLADACVENVRKSGAAANHKVFDVFEKLLSYIPEASEDVLLSLLKKMAGISLQCGLFANAQKFYEMILGENAEDDAAYWGLLQAKLKCRNEDELVKCVQPIGGFPEFENAQLCAADDKDKLNHYIEVRDRQTKHIKTAKKRRRIIKIGSVVLAAVIVVAVALVGWFSYYNSQKELIYDQTDSGYSISAGTFYEAESTLVIPAEWEGKAVTEIADGAFEGHDEIEQVVLPETIQRIGANAFAGCVNLHTVTFASSRAVGAQTALREIGDGAFSGCEKLETFDLPYGVASIGARAFADTGLTEVTVPNTVNYIGEAAFSGCTGLKTIVVGDRESIPTEWAETWQEGCNAEVQFRLRVTFDYNGATAGNTVAEQYVLFGGEFTFPVPSRAGYVFDGWFRDDTRLTDGQGDSVADWGYQSGGTLVAHWAPNINEVVFHANGGEGDMAAQQIATDATANLTANTFTRKGYTFAGWAESSTGSVVYNDGAEYTMGAESLYELFAVWTANRNEIVFDGNGATGGEMDSQYMATDSSASLSGNTFVKKGYTFTGWATNPDGMVQYADGARYTMGTDAKYTLYAVWELTHYSIGYKLNNGTQTDNPTEYTIESEDITLRSPVREGYRFVGWTGTELTEPTLSVTISAGSVGDREYTAVWEANTNQVIFHAEGGSGDMPNQQIKTDQTAVLSECLFERTGYDFIGWAQSSGGAVAYVDGANYMMGAESEYHLYAVWKAIEFDIHYTLNGGSVSGNPRTYTVESDTFRLENPVRAGYTFTGWTGTGLSEPSLVVTVIQGSAGERSYIANWAANTNKIIFHACGGTGEMSEQEIQTDASAPLSACAFERLGYTFVGWSTSEDGAAEFADGETYIMGTQAQYDLYAVWQLEQYTIKYTLNGGTDPENPASYTVITQDFTLEVPTRAGYTFIGWSGTGIEGLSATVTVSVGSTGNREYTANWEANENEIIFNANGGEGEMQPQVIKTDSEAALQKNTFERPGYAFAGWALSEEGDVAYTDGATYAMGTSAEYHLYAVWTPNLNTVEFDGNGSDSGEMSEIFAYTGEIIYLPENLFEKTGYSFIGWSTQSDGRVEYGDNVAYMVGVHKKTILFAVWEANCYEIRLDPVGGEVESDTKTVYYDSDYSLPVPFKQGYVFLGWYNLVNQTECAFTDSEGNSLAPWSVVNLTFLYALYRPCLNVITFDSNGGEGVMSKVTGYSDSEVRLPATAFTKDGYRFAGWSNASDGILQYFDRDLFQMGVNSNNVLYALWLPKFNEEISSEYVPISNPEELDDIRYDLDGKYYLTSDINMEGIVWEPIGTEEKPFTGILYGGGHTIFNLDEIEMATLSYNPKKGGVSNGQLYYYLSARYGVGLFGYCDGAMIHSINITDFDWTIPCTGSNVDKKSHFNYYAGAVCAYADETDIQGCYVQGKINFVGNEINTRYGGGIAGWGTGISQCLMPRITILSTIKGYFGYFSGATSEAEIIDLCSVNNTRFITYFIDSDNSFDQWIPQNAVVCILPMPQTKWGYTFMGWSRNQDGEVEYMPGDDFVIDESMTKIVLYPVWLPHIITFNSNGGVGTMENLVVEPNSIIEVPNCSYNPPPGYYFLGWATMEGGEVEYYIGDSFTMPSEEVYIVKFYAVWAKI